MSKHELNKLVDRAVATNAAKVAKMEKKQKKDSAQHHRMLVLRDKKQKELAGLKDNAEVVIKLVLTESDKMWHLFWESFLGRICHTQVVLEWGFDSCEGIVVAILHTEPKEAVVMHFPEMESLSPATLPSSEKKFERRLRELILGFKLALCRQTDNQTYGIHWQETDNPHEDTVTALKGLANPASAIKSMVDCITW